MTVIKARPRLQRHYGRSQPDFQLDLDSALWIGRLSNDDRGFTQGSAPAYGDIRRSEASRRPNFRVARMETTQFVACMDNSLPNEEDQTRLERYNWDS